jgi:hypothetical protein
MDEEIGFVDGYQKESDDKWKMWVDHLGQDLEYLRGTMGNMSHKLEQCEQRIIPTYQLLYFLHIGHESK